MKTLNFKQHLIGTVGIVLVLGILAVVRILGEGIAYDIGDGELQNPLSFAVSQSDID